MISVQAKTLAKSAVPLIVLLTWTLPIGGQVRQSPIVILEMVKFKFSIRIKYQNVSETEIVRASFVRPPNSVPYVSTTKLPPGQFTNTYLDDNFPWDTEELLTDPVLRRVEFADGTVWNAELALNSEK